MKIFRITPGINESIKYFEPHIFENSSRRFFAEGEEINTTAIGS